MGFGYEQQYNKPGDNLSIESVGLSLPLREIYGSQTGRVFNEPVYLRFK